MSVSKFIIVLDVVVDERGFMKGFHRHGDSTDRIRNRDGLTVPGRGWLVVPQGVISRQCDEGPKPFSAFAQPVVSDGFSARDRIARVIQHTVLWRTVLWRAVMRYAARSRQQGREFVAEHVVRRSHERYVRSRLDDRLLLVGFQDLHHPIIIHRGALAVTRMQRDRVGWDAALNDFLKRLFQHVETCDAENAVDIAADYDLA